MSYLGNQPAANFASVTKDTFSGNATATTFTLSKTATTNGVAVFVENVRQVPTTAYTVSGTTLDFGSGNAPPTGTNNIYVLHHNAVASTATHPSGQNLLAVDGTFSGDATIGDDLTFNSDGAVLSFGADADVTLTHVADQGLTLKSTATDGASGLGPILNLSTGDTDIAAANQLGTINFQAPDEATGTDAQLVVASITAIAQEAFAADANGTSLLLRTSDSGTNDATHLELTNSGFTKCRKDNDTDYSTNQTQNNVVLNLRNETSGASNCVGLSFSTESNGEQYITAVQNTGNSASDLAFGARNGGSRAETMRMTAAGKLQIGSTNTAGRLNINFDHSGGEVGIDLIPNATTATMLQFKNSGGTAAGSITTGGSSTAFNTSSDYRLKENVNYDWDATSRLKQLKPARFNFKADADTTVDGFLAHEVSNIVPESISGTKDETRDLGTIKDKDGNVVEENVLETKTKKDEEQTWTKTKTEDVYQGIDQSKLVPLLVKTIQELEARVAKLEEA